MAFPHQSIYLASASPRRRELLKQIDDLEELKVTLAVLRYVEQAEGNFHSLQAADLEGMVHDAQAGLEKAAKRGTLIRVDKENGTRFFLNSPRGRAAAEAYTQGNWKPGKENAGALVERPNIFKLYEENIGPLTPLIADALKDAEETYPPEQVAEALEIAVKMNKRSWKYVEAILRRWKEEGHAKKQDRRNSEELRGEAVKRKVEEFFNN